MPQSAIDISNIALASIGADMIRDFNENNKRARMCEVFIPILRDRLLAMGDWRFARKIDDLQEVSPQPDDDLPTAYVIPSDCITPITILPKGADPRWEVIGSYIHTAQDYPKLLYTARIDNTGLFTEPFSYALSMMLAAAIAPSIASDKGTVSTAKKDALIAVNEGLADDANVGSEYRHPDEHPDVDTFIDPDMATGASTTL